MMLARVCRSSISPNLVNLLKTPINSKPFIPRIQSTRLFANDGRSTFARSTRKSTSLSEQAMAPAGETAFTIGKGVVAGGAVIGLGSLCYYGLGLSPSMGAIDYAKLWPQYVKDRIKTTYMYLGASIITSAATAAICIRSPTVMNLIMRQGWLAMFVSLASVWGSGILLQTIPYKEGFGAKQIAWLIHTGTIGAFLAPLYLFGGPLVLRAAWYTAGVVGGLSVVAICAPNEKFLNMGGPLAIGLGLVFASSVGTIFLPPTTAIGSGLYSISLYGGLVLFSMLLLYDTQKIIKQAENYPAYNQLARPYDPVNNAISVYMDVVNIFLRILTILVNGGNRRKN
ncbi:growth hormone-inducible transmembrane protein-like [Apis dorsata]|uniref:growth hormone-inducible transmembrane protein-like n=1 Tax=Apis dorsata TaxID=7462 RepID=UPI0003DF62C1|nr:growth hormone-inducible transmembrane protein-like [Apis dorsata]XP_006607179.1 growth hormone-inducible transmembrane protein-like [Apis dorsata]XP_006607180.1 growth hormone-inducible transmembrane protein-like [Apis dorsata]XP_006607181.1 growth hormone-inducible transmembrane protein-like [Apis dorsata]